MLLLRFVYTIIGWLCMPYPPQPMFNFTLFHGFSGCNGEVMTLP